MDYLDPKKKRAHRIRLYIGYALMAVAIGLSTLILLFIGSGYYFDGENGLIQNGLLYVDANPEEAEIRLNGELQRSKTNARLVVPGGKYDVELTREGYRPWRRSLILDEGKVRRLTYPRLIPNELKTNVAQTFGKTPDFVTQSQSREFMLMRFADQPLNFLLIDADQIAGAPTTLTLPSSLLVDPNAVGTFDAVEWSGNNRYVLLKHIVPGRVEYIVFDHQNPGASRNVTKTLALGPNVEVSLRDRAENRVLVFDRTTQTARYGDLGNATLEQPVLSNVLDVKGFEDNKLLFVTPKEGSDDEVSVRLRDGDRTYIVRDVAKDERYFLEIAKFGNSIVVAAGAPKEGKVGVYRNIANYLNANPERTFALATTVLLIDKLEYVSFSVDASVVVAYGAGQFASHEFEADRSYKFNISETFDSSHELRWMDSSRLNYVSAGLTYSVDFDGSNVEKLVSGASSLGVYYDRDFENLVSFTVSSGNTLFQLTSTSLRL